jgi:hypothetical protein
LNIKTGGYKGIEQVTTMIDDLPANKRRRMNKAAKATKSTNFGDQSLSSELYYKLLACEESVTFERVNNGEFIDWDDACEKFTSELNDYLGHHNNVEGTTPAELNALF